MWEIPKVRIKTIWMMVLGILMAVFLVACVPKAVTDGVSDVELETAPSQNRIEKMTLHATDGETSLVVISEAHMTYTAVKEKDPPGVRLYFPDTILAENALPEEAYGGAVLSFFAENISDTEVRLGIILQEDFPYEIKVEGEKGLRIVFNTAGLGDRKVAGSDKGVDLESLAPENGTARDTVPAIEAPAAVVAAGTAVVADTPTATTPATETAAETVIPQLLDVKAETEEEGVRVNILANVPLRDVHIFTVENPPRIVMDIAGLSSPFKIEQGFAVKGPYVHGVRYYAYPDKVRVVLDTSEEGLTEYASESISEGYTVFVGSVSDKVIGENPEKQEEPATVLASGVSDKIIEENLEKKEGSAEVKDLGFTALPEGRSQVFIETTQPVKYSIDLDRDTRFRLLLKDTQIPERHQRPLVTKGFESALDQVLPFMRAEGEAVFVMEMREPVAYVVNQQGNRLELRFEASSVAPRPISGDFVGDTGDETPLPLALGAAGLLPAVALLAEGDVPVSSEVPENGAAVSLGTAKKTFSGIPITIDFYETDIKNAFRILQHISGRNFAIDKDVAGKVTMSMAQPVPWDQVMDLVLRMNGLGLVEEGNIIRIATMDTLRKEEVFYQEILRAKQENARREVALAPLATEYILINYSNVSSEIMPHIQHLLTERGKASADSRNNQLILTDTADVIAKARGIIARIDKITPQVVIEARIVEASETFGRDLGVEWNANTDASNPSPYATSYSNTLGGDYGYNISINPLESSNSIGLHFARIAGTQLALNATLNLSEQRGETKIIASPRIVTLDNKKATITQGFEYPYQTTDEDGNVTTEFKNVDLRLEVVPHVTADNRVVMNINIDKDDVYEITEDGPALRTKKIETELLVNDGDTVVIGGIVTSDIGYTDNHVPFLSRIPLLGWLFRNEEKREDKTELLIFLTPRIVQLENKQM